MSTRYFQWRDASEVVGWEVSLIRGWWHAKKHGVLVADGVLFSDAMEMLRANKDGIFTPVIRVEQQGAYGRPTLPDGTTLDLKIMLLGDMEYTKRQLTEKVGFVVEKRDVLGTVVATFAEYLEREGVPS